MSSRIIALEKFYNSCRIVDHRLTTPTLYTFDKNGGVRNWTGYVVISDMMAEGQLNEANWQTKITWKDISFNSHSYAAYYTTYQKNDGKITTSAPKLVISGKNIGKKNETTPFQQAVATIMSEYDKKINNGAQLDVSQLHSRMSYDNLIARNVEHPNRVKVMLLHDGKKHEKYITYPCYVQPKYNGMHIVATAYNGAIDLYSRGITKIISQEHLRQAFAFLTQPKWRGWYVTGEFYDALERQNIASIFGQEKDKNVTERLAVYVFDVFCIDQPDMPFSKRLEILQQIVDEANSPYVCAVDTQIVKSREELEKYFDIQVKNGMEGIIIRGTNSKYEFGLSREIRSHGTLKYKDREDSEFKITGFKDGIGTSAGAIIFIMECPNGEYFNVVPSWTIEERRRAFEVGATYIGKLATVSYDGLSVKGIPQQPVLLEVY